jgi:hypothetical protein
VVYNELILHYSLATISPNAVISSTNSLDLSSPPLGIKPLVARTSTSSEI